MNKYNYPPSYSFFKALLNANKFLNDPIKLIRKSMALFGDSYTVHLPNNQKMIMTQNSEFIDYFLRKNHKNYDKSHFVSEIIGQFIGNGLLTANGAFWLRQRRLIQPGFHLQKIVKLYDNIENSTKTFLTNFPLGDSIDIYKKMNEAALEIIINSLFDIEIPAQTKKEFSTYIYEIQLYIIKEIRRPHFKVWYQLSGQTAKAFEMREKSRLIVEKIINDRKKSNDSFNDLLDMLMATRYEDTGEGMTETQLIYEIMILIIAGHETTANTLSWALFLLAKNPEYIDKIRKETLGKSTLEITQNKLLSAVINETMRLYPPAYVSDRICKEDDSFDGFNYKKGTILIAFYFGLHRKEDLWDEPEKFNPQRFMDSGNSTSKIFYPFGAGPRMCIGNNFAMAEMHIFLQKFLSTYDISFTSEEPNFKPLITLKPEGLVLNIRKRNE